MALYPPWATWCVPFDHKTHQYGFILSTLNYPECAEKLAWTRGLALDILLLQWLVATGVTFAAFLALRSPAPHS